MIIPRPAYDLWLDPKVNAAMVKPLLVPCPATEMDACPVTKVVNSPRNEVAECAERVGWL
jgi:putative SOS response-associated peptidase YedK